MARIARMPHVYWDKHKRRYFVERRVPDDLVAIIGKTKFKRNFPQSVDRATANALSVEIVREWESEWLKHRPPVVVTLPARPVPRIAVVRAVAMIGAANGDGGVHRDALIAGLDAIYGEQKIELPADHPALVNGVHTDSLAGFAKSDQDDQGNVFQVYRFEQCVRELWVPRRKRAGKSNSEATIEKLVGSKIRRLVGYLGTDDMRPVTRDQLERYFDTQFDGAAIGTIRDHIIQVKSLFALAHDRGKIPHNPAKALWYSKENNSPGRPFLPSERDAIIRAAWGCEDDTIKWLWLLGCFYGPRIAEFAEANLRDIVVENAVPIIFLDTLHRKGEERTLKTAESRRWVPLHSALRGPFMARVELLRATLGDDAPLFPDLKQYGGRRNKDASRCANHWLSDVVAAKAITIVDAENKSYHSLRHTVSTALKGRKWADFLTGHAAGNVKGRIYEHPPLDEVVADVETLSWPAADS
jgi:integrase